MLAPGRAGGTGGGGRGTDDDDDGAGGGGGGVRWRCVPGADNDARRALGLGTAGAGANVFGPLGGIWSKTRPIACTISLASPRGPGRLMRPGPIGGGGRADGRIISTAVSMAISVVMGPEIGAGGGGGTGGRLG